MKTSRRNSDPSLPVIRESSVAAAENQGCFQSSQLPAKNQHHPPHNLLQPFVSSWPSTMIHLSRPRQRQPMISSSSSRFHVMHRWIARFHASQLTHQARAPRSVCSLHSSRMTQRLSFTDPTPTRHFGSSSILLDVQNHRRRSNQRTNTGRADFASLTRQLLSDSITNNRITESYKLSLEQARTDESLIKSLGLSESAAQSMYLMPQNILRDVHLAVSHFSKRDNHQGIALGTHKIPGPVLCVQLLELIGIPQYYSDLPASSDSSPRPLIVHSSQIDQILHCCLQTALALSNSCKAGKGSLIGHDFNSNGNWQLGGKKTAAHVCEDIWRAVHNMEIKFTFERKDTNSTSSSQMQMPSILSNLNLMNESPLVDYFKADNLTSQNIEPWSKKDHRRYKQGISLFNSTLAAYARLGSTTTGTHHGIRREMAQSAERILLELAAKNNAVDPSPSTILQCVRPDIISFNTVMNAWSQLGSRLKSSAHDEHTESIATLYVEKTESFLEMMQELWDEERSKLSSRQAMQFAWEQCADEKPPQVHAVAPNTSSYNTVLFAHSRSPGSDSYDKAMRLFKKMVDRCNLSCNGRISLMRQNSNSSHVDNVSLEGDHAYPDSRTFVALLGSCSNVRTKFSDSADMIETLYATMKYWNEQLRWSTRRGISPDELMRAQEQTNPILNVFAFNALIKAYASIPKSSLDESLQCCNRIEEIISDMGMNATPDDITRGIAIGAWIQCADFAKHDPAKQEMCVEKACAHLDSLLLPQTMPFHQLTQQDHESDTISSRAVHSLNDVISLCGKVFMPSRAHELFIRAKECNLHSLAILSSTIDALTQSKDIANVEIALQLLIDLEKFMSKTRNADISKKKHAYTYMYNSCIKGFLNVEDGTENAHKLLMRMIQNHSRNPYYIGQPNPTSFALVMDALAKSGRSKEVESLLIKMEELDQRRQNNPRGKDLEVNVTPNIIHYNTLMTSYVRGNHRESAETLYSRMQNDNTLPSPDAVTTSLYFQLQSNVKSSKSVGGELSERAALTSQQAPDINGIELDNLILDTIKGSKSFTPIMKGYVNSGTFEGAKKATELLVRMEEMFAAGDIKIRPDTTMYNFALNAWQNCEQNKGEMSSISPSAMAEEILTSLCKKYKDCHTNVPPNDASFSMCIHSWCNSSEPHAAERAESVLRMKEQFLNRIHGLTIRKLDYNLIISKWRESPDGPSRAAKLFDDMLTKSRESKAYQPPNDYSLNGVLAVYAKSMDNSGAEKAQEYLRHINQLYDEKKSSIRPGMISYRSVISAFIARKTIDSPQKVESLVNEMSEKYAKGRKDLKPDSIILDLVLKACNLAPVTWNRSREEKANSQIIEIANRTFAKLRASSKQTHSTYAFMFRIYYRHMDVNDPRYELLMKNLWAQCCRDGLVSEFTLESLRLSVKESTFFECIGRKKAESVTVNSLSSDWRRNVAARSQVRGTYSLTK